MDDAEEEECRIARLESKTVRRKEIVAVDRRRGLAGAKFKSIHRVCSPMNRKLLLLSRLIDQASSAYCRATR